MKLIIGLVGRIFFRQEIELIAKEIKKILNSSEYKLSQSPHLLNALIQGEDRRFFLHPGYDCKAIIRAIRNRIYYKKKEGASTIEQQLVRTIAGDYRKNLHRKIKEISIATNISRNFSKKELAYTYITIGYYGWRMNGIKQAYKRLDIQRECITFHQAALIVSRLKYPEPKSPNKERIERINSRAQYIKLKAKKSKILSQSELRNPLA